MTAVPTVSAPFVTVEDAPWLAHWGDANHVTYTVQWGEGHFAFGSMAADVWAVYAAAGHPVEFEDAGLVWKGDPEYGNYAIA